MPHTAKLRRIVKIILHKTRQMHFSNERQGSRSWKKLREIIEYYTTSNDRDASTVRLRIPAPRYQQEGNKDCLCIGSALKWLKEYYAFQENSMKQGHTVYMWNWEVPEIVNANFENACRNFPSVAGGNSIRIKLNLIR